MKIYLFKPFELRLIPKHIFLICIRKQQTVAPWAPLKLDTICYSK